MGIEAQAPERTVKPVGGAPLATIESLRARLLAERAASKDARENVHKIAIKVSELQSQLDAEIEQRKKAEVAMKEVLEVLQAKGVAMEELVMAITSIPVRSESEEAVQLSSSKDGDSERSSGEDMSQIDGIFNQQGCVVEVPHMKDLRCQSEAGALDADSFSGKTQLMVEDTLKRDALELEKVLVLEDKHFLRSHQSNNAKELAENGELIKDEQVVFNDVLDEDPCTSQGESNMKHPHKMLDDFSQDYVIGQVVPPNRFKPNVYSAGASLSDYLENAACSYQAVDPNLETTMGVPGEQSFIFNRTLPLHASIGETEKSKGFPPEDIATVARLTPSGVGDGDIHGNGRVHPIEEKIVRELPPKNKAPLLRESTCIHGDGRVRSVQEKTVRCLPTGTKAPPTREITFGIGPNYMGPAVLTRGSYPYERLYMNADPLQHTHYVPPPEAPVPFSRGPRSSAYTAGFARHPPQVPVSDAILSLVDDRSGKLGSILMALNLAKQQINDEDCFASYMEEECEATTSIGLFIGKPYQGLHEAVPHQPLIHRCTFEPQLQVPIVYFPISPRSDHEPSPYEEHDGVGRNTSSTPAYHVPGYDPYIHPKGELHLGNGITLYTD